MKSPVAVGFSCVLAGVCEIITDMACDGRLVVRCCQKEDPDTLHRIDCACFPPQIAYSSAELLFHLRHRDAVVRVAEQEGTIVGFAIGRILERNAAHVVTLDVVPEMRRRGIGSALLEALHAEFTSRGVAVAVLEVSVENQGALAFYEGMGYRPEALLRGYYGLADAWRMTRALGASRDYSSLAM